MRKFIASIICMFTFSSAFADLAGEQSYQSRKNAIKLEIEAQKQDTQKANNKILREQSFIVSHGGLLCFYRGKLFQAYSSTLEDANFFNPNPSTYKLVRKSPNYLIISFEKDSDQIELHLNGEEVTEYMKLPSGEILTYKCEAPYIGKYCVVYNNNKSNL